MSCDFGFRAMSVPSQHTFVSYCRDDVGAVAPIAALVNQERPVWYDEGVTAGTEWEAAIIRQVRDCKAAVFFVSRNLLARDESYVRDEFRFVTECGKPALCVRLDDLSGVTPSDAMGELWDGLQRFLNVDVSGKPTVEEKAQAVIESLNALDEHYTAPNSDLPQSSASHPTPKPEPKPEGGRIGFWGSKAFKALIGVPMAALAVAGSLLAAQHFLTRPPEPTPEKPEVESVAPFNHNDEHTIDEIPSVNDLRPGDIIVMGKNNGLPIRWLVLDIQGNDVLVISKVKVAQKTFDDKVGTSPGARAIDEVFDEKKETLIGNNGLISEYYTTVKWSNCSLRRWLNGEFYDGAFTAEEKQHILNTRVTTPDVVYVPDSNFQYLGTLTFDGGEDTNDYLFALSHDEYNQYPLSHDFGQWWLRSPGCWTGVSIDQNSQFREEFVFGWLFQTSTESKGAGWRFDENPQDYNWGNGTGYDVELDVRPAMWIRIGQ